MPELFSRMDNFSWLTPSIAEILDQGSTPPGGDGSIRERMLTIQHELGELETPARIVNVRSTPSYTLYIARPETVGRLGNRRAITPNEIKQSIKQLAENHREWLLGFMPQLREESDAVGILLRTDEHRPMSLRRLLVRGTFRKHPSTLAFVLGITLEQQLIVNSLVDIGHLLVVGADNAKQHMIRATLLSLIMLNTPAELRVALAGQSAEAYKYLVGAPHALGRILTAPSEGQRLIDGLVKEIQRRKQAFQDENTANIDSYNEKMKQQDRSELPRILLVLDSLSDESWNESRGNWTEALTELLENGAVAGIHLILTVEDESMLDIPSRGLHQVGIKVVTRASSKEMSNNLPNFHASLLRFVDAFVVENPHSKEPDISPVELCAISNNEIKNVVDYWRQMSKQRYQEIRSNQTSGTTGVTGVLTPPAELIETRETPLPSPPTPDKPSVETLRVATQVLGTQVATPVHKTSQAVATVERETMEAPSLSDIQSDTGIDAELLKQATALAAYLGWLSIGALRDIFRLSEGDAQNVLSALRKNGIVETVDDPTFRFAPLVHPDDGK